MTLGLTGNPAGYYRIDGEAAHKLLTGTGEC